MPKLQYGNQYDADVQEMRRAIVPKLRQIVRLIADINEIVDKVDSKYEFKTDAFNDSLPLDSYPFKQSFDELPWDIAAWADDMEGMNK